MNSRTLHLSALSAALLAALPAWGVGFGDIVMHSRIGEPLRAEVPIKTEPGENIESSCFSLATLDGSDLPVVSTAKTKLLRKILLANAKVADTVVQVEDKFVLNTVGEGKKEGTFEFAVCVNPIGHERRVVRFIRLNEAMETQILAMVAEASLSDDLKSMEDKLDVLREKWGITSGWGMQPGDKGYQPAGLPALNSTVQPEAMINAPMNANVAGVTVKEAMF